MSELLVQTAVTLERKARDPMSEREAQRGRSQHQYDRQSSWRVLRTTARTVARHKLTARCSERAQGGWSVQDASGNGVLAEPLRRDVRGTLQS